ncbi:MAG: hypothetical protein LUF30_07725, partial [Lachnospiraceae bacterium]|nr:hypothetical protein [Lachnospiraceae bacterium]
MERLSDLVISTAGPLPGYVDMPWRQVTAAANSLAANLADGRLLCLQGVLPESMEEAALQADMRQFEAEAAANGMRILKADLQVSRQVAMPQYFVTAFGVRRTGARAEPAASDVPQENVSEYMPERPGEETEDISVNSERMLGRMSVWMGRNSADKVVKPQTGLKHMPERPKEVPERVPALSAWEDGIFLRPGQELLIVRP